MYSYRVPSHNPYKYILRAVMDKLTSRQKDEVLARINSFPFSGFKEKLEINICRYFSVSRYVGSLVGRDLKLLLS